MDLVDYRYLDIIDELVEFEKWLMKIQDFRRINLLSFQRNLWDISKLIDKNRKVTRPNRLDLESLGS
jgi:hypothetical protein